MMKEEPFLELIMHARDMLLDRPWQESNLIYHICKMEQDLRIAVIIAYESLYDQREDNS